MLTKNQLKKILSENNIRPKKRWGQNFLIDKNIKDKIIEKADLNHNDIILEIGPGLGALTEDLAKICRKVIAIEKDKFLSDVLKKRLIRYKNLTIIGGDILGFDISKIVSTKIKIVGNLPYYITTPIIFKLLEPEFRQHIDSIFITVQKEVAQRIVAKPATKDYGSLSVHIQFYTAPAVEMTIKKTAFFPEPDIDSSLLRLEVRDKPPVYVKNESLLFKIVRASFAQRRKTLLKTLSHRGCLNLDKAEIQSILKTQGIDPNRRGETLSLWEFGRLANAISNYDNHTNLRGSEG